MRAPALVFSCLVITSFAVSGCKRGPSRAEAARAAGKRAERESAQKLMGTADEEESGNGNKGKGGGSGANRWRDTGVYVDGRPVGVLGFGELPIGLQPTWVPEEHSVEFDPGYKGPLTRTTYARRYRVIDFLKAAGVDVARIKEIQVMGPKTTEVIIASGKQLRSELGKGLMFRFGAIVGGKAIPVVPAGFGNGMKPDKVSAVMVYIDKKPPVLVRDEGLQLDGKTVEGIPYFGEPMRGGVRVYLDDRLNASINESALEETPSESGPDGRKSWKLVTVLKQNGVDLSKVVEAWVIADQKRKRKITRAELDTVSFTTDPARKNALFLTDTKERVDALALHSHALAPSELPQIRPDEAIN